jgi:galactose mutarotase-like enzyme
MILIENAFVKAVFSAKGAELQSFKSKETDTEYFWSGDPQYWGKFSPVLFPIVGGLKGNTYFFNGQKYKLPRHGFARDRDFKAEQLSTTTVIFTLTDDEDTLKVYPFKFSLSLHYKIEGRSLSCTYHVVNTDHKDTMLFSVGGHPAFAAPVDHELTYDDYFLTFNKDTELVHHKIDSDLITDETGTIKLEEHVLQLNHKLFYEDALVFKTLKSDRITLRNRKNPRGLHFDFEGFPFFGIWAAKDADFVCLEPWCGIADGSDHDQNLETKEGIVALPAGENWERSWSVSCF